MEQKNDDEQQLLPYFEKGVVICPPPYQEEVPVEVGEILESFKLTSFPTSCLRRLKDKFNSLVDLLCAAPSFVELVRASIPEEVAVVVMTDEQKEGIKKGVFRLLQRKDGSFQATLVNQNGEIVKNLPIESGKLTPELGKALNDFTAQIQMARMMESLENIQESINSVLQGQEDDRLAAADSCKQKYIQTLHIQNAALREANLLRLIGDAEDSRNSLMRSFQSKLAFIEKQPETELKKFLTGDSLKKINKCMKDIRIGFSAINQLSEIEYFGYQELNEGEAALQSLNHYKRFINSSLLDKPNIVERLNSIDYAPDSYWEGRLSDLRERMKCLPEATTYFALEEGMHYEKTGDGLL